MVRILLSYWGGLFSGAMLVSQRVGKYIMHPMESHDGSLRFSLPRIEPKNWWIRSVSWVRGAGMAQWVGYFSPNVYPLEV